MMSTKTTFPGDELTALIEAALAEDVGSGDVSTIWTVPADAVSTARIVAKQPLVLFGLSAVEAVFARVDRRVRVDRVADDGGAVEPGRVVVELQGPTRALLTGERVALNFLGRLSGIATLTRTFVDAVAHTEARIIDTRKTTPGWRRLEKAAVVAGGGTNHRMGLYDMVMIKDNHIAAAGGIEAAVRSVQGQNQAGLPVEVEVRSLDELETILPLGVDRVLLDNMSPEDMAVAVARVRELRDHRPALEASGNVNLSTVRSVAETGVDLISVGALTHSAPTADLSMRVDP